MSGFGLFWPKSGRWTFSDNCPFLSMSRFGANPDGHGHPPFRGVRCRPVSGRTKATKKLIKAERRKLLISREVDKSLSEINKKKQFLLEQLRHTYVESYQKKLKDEILALDAEIAAAQKELDKRQRKLF